MITIDQGRIQAPSFPRPREWWEHFAPHGWVTVDVRDDGTIVLDVTGEAHPSQGPRPARTVRRNQEAALVAWLARLPALEVAIVEDPGPRCQCWRIHCLPHAGHCCFTDARVCHANPEHLPEVTP